MKIVLERDVLAEAVAWTARALPARPTVPVLAGIRLQAGEELVLSSFDYDVSAQATVPVSTEEAGTALVSGRLLAEISRSLPAKPVHINARGRPGGADLRQRHLHAADHAGGRVSGAAGDAARGRDHRQRRVRHGGQPVGHGGRPGRHAACPDRRPDRDRRRHADAGVDRPVPAGGPRAALDAGPARSGRGDAGPGEGPGGHRPLADEQRSGVDRAGTARRGRQRRRRHDRVRGRRTPDDDPAAQRRVPALPVAAAEDA